MSNVIFCPVGIPLNFHDAYDKENHWRFTKEHRNYKTIVYQYKDFDRELLVSVLEKQHQNLPHSENVFSNIQKLKSKNTFKITIRGL